jgi:malate dehydrogenase
LSHIASPAQVEGFLPADNGAERALKDADIVVIPAGVPRKPGMTRDDLFVSSPGTLHLVHKLTIQKVRPYIE